MVIGQMIGQDIAGHRPQTAFDAIAVNRLFMEFFRRRYTEPAAQSVIFRQLDDDGLRDPFLSRLLDAQKIGPLLQAAQMLNFIFCGKHGQQAFRPRAYVIRR